MAEKFRILHLEDEPLDFELVQERLEQDGLTVEMTRADTLPDFERALAHGGFDLILSDYTLPGMDARDALKLAKLTRPDVPFIFVSGTIGEEMAIETMRLGASDYVLKQRLNRLTPTLQRALREAREAYRRKEAEAAMREGERRLRLAMDIGAIGSFDLDVASGTIFWDAQARAIVGMGEKSTGHIWDTVHADDRRIAEAAVARALEPSRRESFGVEVRFLWPDGQVHWVAMRGRGVFDESCDSCRAIRLVGVVQDVSEQKHAEEALKAAICLADQAKERAEEANRAKDHFLAVLSHELRTPLTAVLPALDAVRPLVSAEASSYLEVAARNVELEARLIDDLLDINRIARGKVELHRETVDVRPVIMRAVEVSRPEIQAKGIHFAMQLDEHAQAVDADPARLQQVFWNLLQNAVKFTPENGCIGVNSRSADGVVTIEVHDSGAGIDGAAMARIFTAFEQEAKSITRQFGGLGLGLAISKALVEMHGGKICVGSEGKGKGAVFTVELPAAKGAVADQPPGRRASPPPPHNMHILLVEDHSDTARILTHLLKRAGHRVEHAGSVADGLQKARAGRFDVLISDLGLPDGSGHTLMQQLIAEGRRLPAFALSGYGMAEDVQKSLAAGFLEHVTKPVNFQALQDALARVTAGGHID